MNKKMSSKGFVTRAQALILVGMMIVSGSLVMMPGVLGANNSGEYTPDLTEPHGVIGYLYDDTGLVVIPGVTVTVTNPRTGESVTDITDALGRYSTDLQWLPSGYLADDTIYITTEAPNQAFNSITVDTLVPFQLADLIVDLTDPVIGATTIDEPFINNMGTFDGITPPVLITVADVTDNVELGAAGWGIRNDLQIGNSTIYFSCDLTNEAMPATYGWDGSWYFVDGVLVTAGISPNNAGTDLFVMGEVNGASATDDEIGNVMPSHYATYQVGGAYQTVYATLGTPDYGDDVEFTPVAGDTFRAYRYDEGAGYVATSSVSTFGVNPWVPLTIAPVPDGRYAIGVTALDVAGNSAWTNETTGNPVITVDNYPAYANATGPLTSDIFTFDVTYDFVVDPLPSSGFDYVTLWYNLDSAGWMVYGNEATLDGAFAVDVSGIGGDGSYEWYLTAFDNTENHDAITLVAEATTLVDTVDPVIGATSIDEPYINNMGTFGGVAPPVLITVASIVDTNLFAAGWGIRNDLQIGNSTIYFSCDLTNEAMPATYGWDGSWYFVGGVLVTAGISPNNAGTDLFVMGEVNGASATDDEIGNVMPSHYATYQDDGTYQTVYATLGTPDYGDDVEFTPVAGDTFRAYRYDEGAGYVATSSVSTFGVNPWVPLTIAPVPDGMYAIGVSALDLAGNSAWTNETTGNPVITVDNYPAYANATGPAESTVYTFDITYDYVVDPAPSSGFDNVTLWYNLDSAGWLVYGNDATLDGTFTVDLTVLGDGVYEWYMTAFDKAENHDAITLVTEATTIVDGTSPYVVTTTPLDGAIDVPLAAGTYVIEFSEVMDTAFGTVTSDLPGIAWTWSANGMWLNGTYNALTENTTYTVDLSTGGFQDLLTNSLVAGVYGFTFTFEAVGVPPVVVTSSPLDGTIDVALAASTYVIEFNEPMDTGLGTVTTNLPGVAWTWSANGMWLNGTYNALTENTTYNIDLSTGGFEDASGNILVAGGYGMTFSFLSIGISPEIVTTTPLDGAVDVALASADYVIEFNEPMDTGLGTVTSDLPGVVWAWDGTGMWLNGTYALLTESTTYNIDLSTGGFKDVAGNNLVAGGYGWTFTFDTVNIPPEITLTVPADGDNGVMLDADIVIIFSEEMNPATFTYFSAPNPGGWSVVWNGPANDQVTLSHTDYNEFMVYTFTVTYAEDTHGNVLIAGAVANPFTFTTMGTFDLDLVAGWNLIGIPVLNPTIGGTPLATADDMGNQGALMITKWDFASQRYVNYIPGFHTPADPQNFAIQPDEAYWAWMPGVSTISIDGDYPGTISLNVDGPGWNMVSYMNPAVVGDVDTDWAPFVSCGGFDDIAEYTGGVFNHYIFGGDVMALNPGQGYFVWSDAPSVINYGVTPPASIINADTGGSYGTIQAAIDGASPGDNLIVKPGVYSENIDIDESITLQGQPGAIIDGSGSGVVVTLSANGATLSGFTVQNSGANPLTDAGIGLMGVGGCTVDGNTVLNSANGIAAVAAPGNTISNNVVTDAGYYGIVLDENSGFASFGCTVSGNTVTGSGVFAFYAGLGCDGTTISGNTFSDSLGGDGIFLWKSSGNIVDGNTITGNAAGYGIHMFGSALNNIIDNTITGNLDGFRIRESGVLPSNPNSIHNNTIAGNANFGGWSELDGADARWNWWGDVTGPAHPSNTPGLGNAVSDHILFDPWWGDAGMTTTMTVESAGLTYAVDETTLVGDLDTMTATFPVTVPAFFDTASYFINSEIVLAGDVDGDITITRSGFPDMVIVGGLTAGTYTYTEIVALAMAIPEPPAAPFTSAYNGAVEIYTISVENNPAAIDTTVTIRSIISDDNFATRTVLSELIDLPLVLGQRSLTPVNLGTAGDFVILAETGITTTGTTHITGDLGVSPIDSTAITGFGLIMDASGEFSTSSLVTGNVYAANYAFPTPTKMTTAISDMHTAYTDAAGRTLPDYTELYSGDVTGQTLSPGLYKWTTEVLISAGGVTISGTASDVWIFQIAQDLTVGDGAIVTLDGGAQASNIFWQVAGQTTLGTTAQMKGIILCQTLIAMNSGATLEGRSLAQTAVTLISNGIISQGAIEPPVINSDTGASYPTVQAAIDDASTGDTIVFSPGTYTGTLIINQDIILQGNGNGYNTITGENGINAAPPPAASILDGDGGQFCIKITSDNVKISGFQIKNAQYGILVEDIGVSHDNLEISHNTIMSCNYGLRMWAWNVGEIDNANIHDNVFIGNSDYAIYLRYAYGCMITGNDFMSNGPDYQCQNPDGGAPANVWNGNYWSDWTGPDADLDGIVDDPTPNVVGWFICVKNAQDFTPSTTPFHYIP